VTTFISKLAKKCSEHQEVLEVDIGYSNVLKYFQNVLSSLHNLPEHSTHCLSSYTTERSTRRVVKLVQRIKIAIFSSKIKLVSDVWINCEKQCNIDKKYT